DLLFVAYQPHGREFIVDLGPAATYLGATGPIVITQFSAADISGAYGGVLPSDLNLAVFGRNGVDGYLAGNGPIAPSQDGSAIGAGNQINGFGAHFSFASTPVAGNPNAATYDFGNVYSYQATLDARVRGSLGGTVPFSVESALPTRPILVPFFKAQFN